VLGCWQGTEDKGAVIGIDIGKDSLHVVDQNRPDAIVLGAEVSFLASSHNSLAPDHKYPSLTVTGRRPTNLFHTTIRPAARRECRAFFRPDPGMTRDEWLVILTCFWLATLFVAILLFVR